MKDLSDSRIHNAWIVIGRRQRWILFLPILYQWLELVKIKENMWEYTPDFGVRYWHGRPKSALPITLQASFTLFPQRSSKATVLRAPGAHAWTLDTFYCYDGSHEPRSFRMNRFTRQNPSKRPVQSPHLHKLYQHSTTARISRSHFSQH